jgi:hypothetical protein
MAVTLVGEVVNTADAVTGFNVGNISTDDDNVQGTGAIGLKAVTGVNEIYTTTLGATAPYAFNSGQPEFGYHMIIWFNTKTPINATSGLQVVMGNGTDRGRWYVQPAGFYKGGFLTRVINPAAAFDIIAAGTWTVGANPAQLSNVTQVGGAINSSVAIMGNFNNIQLDQFTIGLGVRADAGTVGVPNTFETVRVQDEDTSFWGWWSSSVGSVVGKGKLFIGPATGTAVSVFNASAFKVVFANERVSSTFYEINTRGANTDVTWNLGNISASLASAARWGLTIQSDTKTFSDTNGVWSGAGAIVLNATSTLTGTTLVDCTSLALTGALLSSCSILNANTATGVGFITAANPARIQNCRFTFSVGHAITLTTPGTYTFTGNEFANYGADATNSAAIYNNSGGAITLNIVGGGDTPTIRNGAGASTTVNNAVTLELTGLIAGSRVYVRNTTDAVDLYNEIEATTTFSKSLNFTGIKSLLVRVRNASGATKYKPFETTGTLTSTGFSAVVNQIVDE